MAYINTVKQVGFATIMERPMIGASSDGLVGDDGMIEIKFRTTRKSCTDNTQ